MLKFLFIVCASLMSLHLSAQNYSDSIQAFREKYKKEFLADERSPLKKKDLKYLRFYTPDVKYSVQARFEKILDTIGFDMHTHNGVMKKYFVYGKCYFTFNGSTHQLFVYQSEKLMTKEGFEDYLFIPFTDETNYQQTFGGGRYLDFKMKDIVENVLIIDFNKCYNPYCAFKGAYACPIPPKENDLKISIEAGEKLFARSMKEE